MTGKYKNPEYQKQYCIDNKEKKKKARQEWYKANQERVDNKSKQWRKDNPDKMLGYTKKYNKSSTEKRRRSTIKYRYGLSYEDWQKIWDNQNGQCIICEKPFISPSDACVDHNHKTGEVRGLLCHRCNCGIGYLNDDPKIMAKAIEYVLGDK